MEVMHFGHEYHKSGVVSSVHHFRGYIMSMYIIADDVNLMHVVKVVSARSLYHKITIFFLCN